MQLHQVTTPMSDHRFKHQWFISLFNECTVCTPLKVHEELSLTTRNQTYRNLEHASKITIQKELCWVLLEENPLMSNSIRDTSHKQQLKLCILGGCLRKVQLFGFTSLK